MHVNAGSRGALWTGRGLSALAVLFLTFDSIGKLLEVPPVVAGTRELGYPASTVFAIGVILLLCVVAYAIPRTSVLGALLLTGYLGGAVATHLRVGDPLLSHTLFPIYFAFFVWGGLVLRDARARSFPGPFATDRGMTGMRFIIMHKTNARWEAGAIPSPQLIARVGTLIGELAKANVLLGAEGLRASSQGVRLKFSGGVRTVTQGPFKGENELPAGFSMLRVQSLDEAIEWASRQAEVLGDVEIDIRPVTEAWDIGMVPRPENVTTRRYMALRKATAASEAGVPLSAKQRAEMARLIDETQRTGAHLATETLRPSARGRRYKNSGDGIRVIDGPFTESKELIAGYVMVKAESLEHAARWATRHIDAVEADEVDLREVEE